jgi:MFS family permease
MGRGRSFPDSCVVTEPIAGECLEPAVELPPARFSRQDKAAATEAAQQETSGVEERFAGFSWVARHPAFLRLWLAQLLSQTALNAANYGLIILVATQSGSVTITAVTIVAFTLPAVLWSLPAGVLVDRMDRRTVLWVSNLLRAIGSLLCVLSLLMNHTALLPLYLLAFGMASIGAFFAPAEGATIPLLVPPKHLMAALGLFNFTFTLAQALGLMVLGPLVLHWFPSFSLQIMSHSMVVLPVESLFLMLSLLYLLCTILVFSLPRRQPVLHYQAAETVKSAWSRRTRNDTAWRSFLLSWAFLRQNRLLAAAIWQLTLGGVVTAIMTLLAPSFIVQFLRQPAGLAGLIFIPAGVGLVFGSFFLPRLVQWLHYTTTIVLGVIFLAGSTILLPLAYLLARYLQPANWWHSWPYIGSILFLTFLMGFALDCVMLPAQTRMQEQAPDWIRGRVLALQLWLLNTCMVPAVLVMGPLTDRFGLVPALEILAFLTVSVGLSSLYYLRAGKQIHWDDSSPDATQNVELPSIPINEDELVAAHRKEEPRQDSLKVGPRV